MIGPRLGIADVGGQIGGSGDQHRGKDQRSHDGRSPETPLPLLFPPPAPDL
jgi:hypothetical protein